MFGAVELRLRRAKSERRGASTSWLTKLEIAAMSRAANRPILGHEPGLRRYVAEVNRIPLLEDEEELVLAKRCKDHGDRDAAHRLVRSHLRLVVKVAANYRGYGLPIADLISEGNVGLMQAVERFDPDKGFRLATYALWWIKAEIQQYVIRSTSLVRMGTTSNQRKLFFNLRKAKSRISAFAEGDMRREQVEVIAKGLNVGEQDVIDMNRRLSGDVSLSAPARQDGNSDSWQDWLVDEAPSQEEVLAERRELADGRAALAEALTLLNERERRIFVSRRLVDQPKRLEEVARDFGISRERVRQIEMAAFEKIRRSVTRTAAPMAA
jgi:RNA polymerase sigma-32 factor